MSRLEVTGLTVGYNGQTVLRQVDLEAPHGRLLAVVGPSGSGKTTLLRTIAGLLPADAGRIRIGDRMVATHGIHLAPEKRRVGWVPQDAALFPHLTVAENVAFGTGGGRRSPRAAKRAARGEDVLRLLDLVGLAGLAARLPAQLSGGQAQRVALARALAAAPELVLLDEPFGALDPQLRVELRRAVRRLLRDEDRTGVLVTHDRAEALSIADAVAVLRDGRVQQLASPEALYRTPATPWVAAFVGDAMFLDARLHGDAAECALGRVRVERMPGPDGREPRDGEQVLLMVRPEALAVSPDPASETIVTAVDFGGHDALLSLALPGGERATARVHGAQTVPLGSRLAVTVRGVVLAYPLESTEADG